MNGPGRLTVMSLEEAIRAQFRLVDEIAAIFRAPGLLDGADLGLADAASPTFTRRVEAVLARYFDAGDALLLQGAGTGAIREALATMLRPGGRILVHSPGPYFTTQATLEMMGAAQVRVDMNDLDQVREGAAEVDAVILQHTYQVPEDHYELSEVITAVRAASEAPILVDDNYATLKVARVGCQLGADLSAFSLFKLLGPEGIGCLVGRSDLVEATRRRNPSGGNVVQGPTARAVLEGLVHAPVLLAIQDRVAREVAQRLSSVPGVAEARAVNLAETIVLVRLEEPIAHDVIRRATLLGAADRPVATESRHELVPLVYKVSKTMLRTVPGAAETMVRINPLRSGPDTVMRVMGEAIAGALAGGDKDGPG
jgi:hypothetical protein